MKKLSIFSLAVLVGLGLAASSFAATNAQVTIYVTVVEDGISIARLGGDNVPFGQLTVASSQVGGPIAFRNDGTVVSDWWLETSEFVDSGSTQTWNLVTAAPASINEVRLLAIWDTYPGPPVLADFAVNDALTTSSVEPTTSVFANDAEPNDLVKGFSVPVTGGASERERNLFFRIDAPISGSGAMTVEQLSVVTIVAQASV